VRIWGKHLLIEKFRDGPHTLIDTRIFGKNRIGFLEFVTLQELMSFFLDFRKKEKEYPDISGKSCFF